MWMSLADIGSPRRPIYRHPVTIIATAAPEIDWLALGEVQVVLINPDNDKKAIFLGIALASKYRTV